MLSKAEQVYYQRQTKLKDFGENSQLALKSASVLIVGAGGLGSPAIQYLAGSGIGKIGIVDGDRVELSNLHRQVLFDINSVGLNKAEVAKRKAEAINPHINIEAYQWFLNADLAHQLVPQYDLILDCTDNFNTRYLINDACVLYNKPFVYGAIFKHEGQIALLNYQGGATYRCIFPAKIENNNALNCNEAGVLGVLPGIIGTYQASEAIKFFSGQGDLLQNELLIFNILSHTSHKIKIRRKADDYSAFISANGIDSFNAFSLTSVEIISHLKLEDLEVLDEEVIFFIDVRNPDEQPKMPFAQKLEIPLPELAQRFSELPSHKDFVCICQSGVRSQKAAELLAKNLKDIAIYNANFGVSNEFIELWKNKSKK